MLYHSPMSYPVRRSLVYCVTCLLLILYLVAGQTTTLASDDPLDPGFTPAANGSVLALTPQADGKIMLGGAFTTVNGVGHNRIARLNTDGSLDPTFTPAGGANNWIVSLALQADGKIVLGGAFTTVNGVSRRGIARLHANGSLDPTFAPAGGTNNVVRSVAVQADGKIVLGGAFTTVNSVSRSGIARLNADGSLDPTFAPASGTDGLVSALVLQADGKIVLGGAFTTVNRVSNSRIARLNSDGSLDPTFAPAGGADKPISALVLQADGKIVLGGAFTTVNAISRNYIARLNADGSLDPTFAPAGGANNAVSTLAVQADGKIVLGGAFTTVNAISRNYIARLNADGSLDPTFAPAGGANDWVYSLAVQADGKVVLGGDFTTVNGVSRSYIARLNTIYQITVSRSGTGSGTVSSTPPGISCGSDCSEAYTNGTQVVLAATSDTGSRFSGWSGACSGTAPCTVTMDAAHSVIATFDDISEPPLPTFISPVNGSLTTSPRPLINGTAEPGSTVTVKEGSVTICTALTDANGSWNCTPTSDLNSGPHTITATATDSAGNTSPAATTTFTIDMTAPAPPLIHGPANNSKTDNLRPLISGTAEPGSTVTVKEGSVTICTAVTNANGSWNCTPSSYLRFGLHTISATATDIAGNTSPPTATTTFHVVRALIYVPVSSSFEYPGASRVR